MRPVDPPPAPDFIPGPALNKQPPKGLDPVEDRPGWWRDPRTGIETYQDPPRKDPAK